MASKSARLKYWSMGYRMVIDVALPGDEVVVGDGAYGESLTIDKPLTLRTVSDGGATLDGSGERFERAINGEDVTDGDGTTITSTQAEHTMSVSPGTSYVVIISITDMAGNVATTDTSFDVAADSEEQNDSDSADDLSDDSSGEQGVSDEQEDETASSADDDGPGFGVGGALVALVSLGYLLNRRLGVCLTSRIQLLRIQHSRQQQRVHRRLPNR